jgi:hypothetical protein
VLSSPPMKIDLKGARLVKRQLADGTIKTYYYLERSKGAPRLKGEPGSADFLASYQGAAAKRKRDRERVTDMLIDDYFDSGHFTQRLAERTRADVDPIGRTKRSWRCRSRPNSRPYLMRSDSTSARYAAPAKASRGPPMDSVRRGRRPPTSTAR